MTPVGGSASISNSHLFLGVPGGANHDPLLTSNQAVRVVQEIMGHASITLTYDRYGHLFSDREGDQAAMKRLEAAIVAA